jgi:hypothetical protein
LASINELVESDDPACKAAALRKRSGYLRAAGGAGTGNRGQKRPAGQVVYGQAGAAVIIGLQKDPVGLAARKAMKVVAASQGGSWAAGEAALNFAETENSLILTVLNRIEPFSVFIFIFLSIYSI